MKTTSGMTESAWMTVRPPQFAPLAENMQVDVCVVGAGIAGLTTALLLTRAGLKVAVIDDGEIASGESGRTTAHLTYALDDRYFELIRIHGARIAQLAAESHRDAIEKIDDLVKELQIECDFARIDGYLFAPPEHAQDARSVLQREYAAAQSVGLTMVRLIERAPMEFDTGPALLFPLQAQFHPLKYLSALATAIVDGGGKIFTHSHVSAVEGGQNAKVTTASGYNVAAAHIVIATNTPINDRMVIHTKQAPYRTYAIGIEVPRGSVPPALYWDTADPYHYVRVARGLSENTELLIIGGEDHKTGQAPEGRLQFTQLESWTRERFLTAGELVFSWSGQVQEPVDGLAFIGRNPLDADNVFIATGDSGNGMTHGTIAGMLLTDLICGRENPWADVYAPNRKSLSSFGEYLHENINVAEQFTDWVTPAEYDDVNKIPLNCGGLLRHGLQKIAAFRDDDGQVHLCKAVCPHLGCIVAWNHTERTWDCPCHGSRFTGDGTVVCGPSRANLEKIDPKKANAGN